MFEIDGSYGSGSGTILRLAVALAAVAGEPLHVTKIRANRPQPGLRPQHLEAVLTAAKLCNAKVEGAKLNSMELWFTPSEIVGGRFKAEIGTAGSIPMLLLAVLPICIRAKQAVSLHVAKGGTDVPNSPAINYLRNVFLPVLKCMGVDAQISVQKYGYYPKGNGEATLQVKPTMQLKPLRKEIFGRITRLKGISICTGLSEKKVAERQAKAAANYLSKHMHHIEIQVVNDESNPIQKGSSIVLWAETDTEAVIGADAVGEPGKPSEAVGLEAAQKLVQEIKLQATVDVHLADMLIPYMALAKETSVFLTRNVTDHLQTNIWLAETMLGARFSVEPCGELARVEKA